MVGKLNMGIVDLLVKLGIHLLILMDLNVYVGSADVRKLRYLVGLR